MKHRLPRSPRVRSRPLLALVLLGGLIINISQASESRVDDFTALSLEELMNIEVRSVAKQPQRLGAAPAAVTVITQEDIRRSNLDSIPELLRLSPGLHVARVNSNTWAIGSRGFTDVFGNKLLVLMDGRTLYNPLFSGVFWDGPDYILEDLDRIEVIRGPGATLWGANAVNGVINITTKDARDTQGLLVTGLLGTAQDSVGIRYGDQIDDQTWYRVYGKFRNFDDFRDAAGDRVPDGWESFRTGFRIDRHASDRDVFTLQGDVYRNINGALNVLPSFVPPFTDEAIGRITHRGENILGRWTHIISPESEAMVQIYYDRLFREELIGRYTQHTIDLEFQHRFPLTRRQEITWGLGYRYLINSIEGTDVLITPRHRDDHLISAFVQNAIAVVPERWTLFLGSKFEYNTFSQFEIQPSARLLWTPDERNSVWAAVSRAVRTPSQVEHDARVALSRTIVPPGLPLTTDFVGNPRYNSEELTASELGYRVQVTSAIAFDIVGFVNVYDNLRSIEMGPVGPDPLVPGRLLLPMMPENRLSGEVYGLELASTVNLTPDWRVVGAYTLLNMNLHTASSSSDTTSAVEQEGDSPQHQFQLRSYYNLTRQLELNAALFYVDNLPGPGVSSYCRLDLAVTWRPNKNFELTAGVQNLLDDRHREFGDDVFVRSSEVPRSVFVQATWRY